MRASIFRFVALAPIIAGSLVGGCGEDPADVEMQTEQQSSLTANQRLAACNQDPRVVAGLVTAQICAGADIFFRETFNGNGRTCGTCHPADHNLTIDDTFIQNLHNTNPADPLFVFEREPKLAQLEDINIMLGLGSILENVDGFEDAKNKFIFRAVPHTLSMATSIARDTGDGTTNPPVERTGWSGDGAPGDGSLRQFLNGAITQHYTKTLDRRVGPDFRLATAQELDLTLAFQLSLGRLNDLNLSQVRMFNAEAEFGRQVFLDPVRGRCNICHANAGANSLDTGKNRNFDTGVREIPAVGGGTFNGKTMFDGGFGGQGQTAFDIEAFHNGTGLNGFGNGTFNTPPLIEAVDTGPFFHTNGFGHSIESAIFFYGAEPFTSSPAARDLEARFGGPLVIPSQEGFSMGRFLRGLNIALNCDIAKQKLRAALTLANRFGDTRVDIQLRLLQGGQAEIDDALRVLNDGVIAILPGPFYPVAIDRLNLAKQEIAAALIAPASSRAGRISNAVSRVENARDQIGSNITYQLGTGNIMF